MENEIWKDIVGFEGRYQVSNIGNVKAVERIRQFRKGRFGFWAERPLISSKNEQYNRIQLINKEGKSLHFSIHRLVAQAFVENLDPINKKIVNHINGIKYDNRAVNLEWCTNQENMNHAVSMGLIKKGKDNQKSKTVLNTETGIFYDCVREAEEAHGFGKNCLTGMLNGTRKNKTSLIYA